MHGNGVRGVFDGLNVTPFWAATVQVRDTVITALVPSNGSS